MEVGWRWNYLFVNEKHLVRMTELSFCFERHVVCFKTWKLNDFSDWGSVFFNFFYSLRFVKWVWMSICRRQSDRVWRKRCFFSVIIRYMKSSWGSSWALLESDSDFFHFIRASTVWVVVEVEIAIKEQLWGDRRRREFYDELVALI